MEQHNAYFYLIPKLGILTVLYLLEIYEADENFEECGRIMEGISAFNIRYKTDFPTRTDIPKELKDDIKFVNTREFLSTKTYPISISMHQVPMGVFKKIPLAISSQQGDRNSMLYVKKLLIEGVCEMKLFSESVKP